MPSPCSPILPKIVALYLPDHVSRDHDRLERLDVAAEVVAAGGVGDQALEVDFTLESLVWRAVLYGYVAVGVVVGGENTMRQTTLLLA